MGITKYIYILNSFRTKSKTASIIKRIKDASRASGREYEIHINETLEDARKIRDIYRDTEYVLTAVGGDGSINNLLNCMVGTKNVLSFIPLGTGNDFYRTVSQSFESGIHEVDIVRINDRYFINVACFGIDADIANDDQLVHNRLIPKPLRFHSSVLYHFLTYRNGRHLRLECAEELCAENAAENVIEKKFTTIVVTNSRYYGGGYQISPSSQADDGIMEIYTVDHVSRPKMAKAIMSMKNAGHLKNPAVTVMKARKAVISSSQPICANIDGEPLCSDRFEIELIPGAIRLEYDEAFLSRFRSNIRAVSQTDTRANKK